MIAGIVLLAFIALVAALARQPRTVRVGDHWHARLAIELCGTIQPPLPPGPGDVHTHGDGIIHIHPATPRSAGGNASLQTFFRTTPVTITPMSIAVGGEHYRNGERCPDGRPGALNVLVRHGRESAFHRRRNFLSYLPQDGDDIRVVFGP